MITVFKYELPFSFTGESKTLPYGFKILTVRYTGQKVYMWAQVDTEAPSEKVIIRAFPTGQTLGGPHPDLLPDYIGTIFDENQEVWHFYIYRTPKDDYEDIA